MTWQASVALFWALVILAAIPGPGILVVVSRTLTRGLRAGATTTLGIISGDFIFIALAIAGLSALAEQYQTAFLVVKYLGAAYLMYLGLSLLLRQPGQGNPEPRKGLHSVHYLAGLLTTLSNPKAILFYASFFPAFVDLSAIATLDFIWILSLATVAVGGVMMTYVWLAHRGKSSFASRRHSKGLRYASGITLFGSGIFVASRGA
jgi:threonine/homoserine/homoserine lactone efflux protein